MLPPTAAPHARAVSTRKRSDSPPSGSASASGRIENPVGHISGRTTSRAPAAAASSTRGFRLRRFAAGSSHARSAWIPAMYRSDSANRPARAGAGLRSYAAGDPAMPQPNDFLVKREEMTAHKNASDEATFTFFGPEGTTQRFRFLVLKEAGELLSVLPGAEAR